MCSKKFIIQWEQEALHQQNSGNIEEAAKIFKKIVNEDPNYEHGMCFYNLACCLEDMNSFKEAEKYFLKSLEYQPDDDIRIGGYASFLYLHGEPRKALEYFLKLWEFKKKYKMKSDSLVNIIKELGIKSGLKEEEVLQLLKK